jgi:hypothetical protein
MEHTMSKTIITPPFRGISPSLLTPRAFKLKDGTDVPPAYRIIAAFGPEADLTEIEAAIQQEVEDEWKGKPPKYWRNPIVMNDDRDQPIKELPEDWATINMKSRSDIIPGVVDSSDPPKPITDDVELYSGAWYRAQVSIKAYTKGNCGVGVYLLNVQKIGDDDAINLGRASAQGVFAFAPKVPDAFKKPVNPLD